MQVVKTAIWETATESVDGWGNGRLG